MTFIPTQAQAAFVAQCGRAYLSQGGNDNQACIYRLTGRRIERTIVDREAQVLSVEDFTATPADINRFHSARAAQAVAA